MSAGFTPSSVRAGATVSEAEDTCLGDPVEFLARMREDCPNILSVLSTKQARLLAKDPTSPYETDEEYLTDMAAANGVKRGVDESKSSLRSKLLKPPLTTEEVDVERFEKLTATLTEVSHGEGSRRRYRREGAWLDSDAEGRGRDY